MAATAWLAPSLQSALAFSSQSGARSAARSPASTPPRPLPCAPFLGTKLQHSPALPPYSATLQSAPAVITNFRNDDFWSAEKPPTGFYARKFAQVAQSVRQEESNSSKGSTLEHLTVSQLKQVLDAGGVDYRDCLEKKELVDRLSQTQNYIPSAAQALLSRFLASDGSAAAAPETRTNGSLASPEFTGGYLEAERNTIRVFQACGPSVVNISTTAAGRRGFLWGGPEEVPRGTGSGLVWDCEGHIVTNFHVVMAASGAQVTLADGSTWDAELVGAAKDKDLAVLKVRAPAEKLKPISVGTSQALQVGQYVLAIGNPFGLDRTLTSGIVSGVGRDIRGVSGATIRGVVQTDAAINPGNSGGPLLDSQGRLIGINTMIYSRSGASAGVGFAIPVDTVRRVVNQLIRTGKAVRPAMGVICAPEGQAKQLGVSGGVLVMGLMENGPAAQAGIKATSRDDRGRIVLGDVITAINGQSVASTEDVISAVEERRVGEKVRVTVRRGTGSLDVYITLAETSE